jgi:hypothetical protein
VHDNFETKYELTIMVREVVEQVVLVHKVLDIDYLHMFDVNAMFANQLIFDAARNTKTNDTILHNSNILTFRSSTVVFVDCSTFSLLSFSNANVEELNEL